MVSTQPHEDFCSFFTLGHIFAIPQRASGILHIVPYSLLTSTTGEDHVEIIHCGRDLAGVKDKFEGGVLSHDGAIYCMPLRSRICVKVIPACGTRETYIKTRD